MDTATGHWILGCGEQCSLIRLPRESRLRAEIQRSECGSSASTHEQGPAAWTAAAKRRRLTHHRCPPLPTVAR
eukprot:4351972-Pyramimonas_sp.AAC.1